MRGKVTFFCTILLICGILCGTKKVAAEECSAGYDDMFTLEFKQLVQSSVYTLNRYPENAYGGDNQSICGSL